MNAISNHMHDKVYQHNRLQKEMEKEGCELITPYDLTDSYIKYKFNNNVYQVFPYKWYQGYHPHITGKTSPTDKFVRQSFYDPNCELINENRYTTDLRISYMLLHG